MIWRAQKSAAPEVWLSPLPASVGVAALPLRASEIGREVAIPRHLQDGEEFQISLAQLLEHGRNLFTASWTIQEGGGRPMTKGTGAPQPTTAPYYSKAFLSRKWPNCLPQLP